eukprot:5247003-Pleurochrysis_carterae.AAC.2
MGARTNETTDAECECAQHRKNEGLSHMYHNLCRVYGLRYSIYRRPGGQKKSHRGQGHGNIFNTKEVHARKRKQKKTENGA